MKERPDSTRSNETNGPAGVDSWLQPFFTDSALWPVVLVTAGCLGTLGAAMLVAALYVFNYAAIGALLLLAWMSSDAVIRNRKEGRFGLLGRCIMSLWFVSALLAIGAVWLGLA